MSLHYIHTAGSHPPLDVDRMGYPLADNEIPLYSAKIEKTIYVFKQVKNLLCTLKKRGLYDNSIIVLAADHGSLPFKRKPENPKCLSEDYRYGCARPILFVKPVGAEGMLRYSAAPTTHSRLAALMRTVLNQEIGHHEIQKILVADKRLYRNEDGMSLFDTIFDSVGHPHFIEPKTVVSVENLEPLKIGETYLALSKEATKPLPFIVSNCVQWVDNGYRTVLIKQNGLISFRTDENCNLKLTIKVLYFTGRPCSLGEHDEFMYRITDMKTGKAYQSKGDNRWPKPESLTLSVCPDQNGIVRVKFESPYLVNIHSVQLDEW